MCGAFEVDGSEVFRTCQKLHCARVYGVEPMPCNQEARPLLSAGAAQGHLSVKAPRY